VKGIPLPAVGALLELDVDGMDDEGRGRANVGEEDTGYDVAVRGAFPGDRVRARVERVFAVRRLVQAVTASVVDEGSLRIARVCRHGGPCAACPLEGADPSLALALKRARIEDALRAHDLSAAVDDVVTPPSPYGRRQKVKLVCGGTRGHVVLGLYAPHSHALVAAHLCPYVDPEVSRAVEAVRATLSASGALPGEGGVRAVIARAFASGVGVIVQSARPLDDDMRRALVALVPAHLASIGVRIETHVTNSLLGGAREHLAGPSRMVPKEGGPAVETDAFAQPDPDLSLLMNSLAAAFLVDGTFADDAETLDRTAPAVPGHADAPMHAPAFVRRDSERIFVDAYAGTGAFTRALLARGASHVIAIERSPDVGALSDDARVDARTGDVEPVARALVVEGTIAQGVVADPARRGLGFDVHALVALGAARFVLVSCDPQSMGRDVRAIVDAGYRVARVLPIDLFPGTPEIETMVFLERHAET